MPMVLIGIHEDDDGLQPTEDDLPGPESDGQGILTYMLSDPDHEHDEEEASLFGPTTTLPVRMSAKSSRVHPYLDPKPGEAKGQTVLRAEVWPCGEGQNHIGSWRAQRPFFFILEDWLRTG